MKSKRGSTLAEMVIALAVIGIMTVMIVTFTILCNAWTKLGIERYDINRSAETINNVFRSFVNSSDDSDNYFITEDNVLSVRLRADDSEIMTLAFENGMLLHTENETTGTYPIENINSIRFSIRNNETTGKQLIVCKIQYKSPKLSTSKVKNTTEDLFLTVCTRAAGGE